MKQLFSPTAFPLMKLLAGLVRPFSCSRSRFARAFGPWVAALLALAPNLAWAHADLDRAREHAAEAEFDAALTAFEAALSSDSLTHDELVTLLAERILVLHALGKKQQLDDDLSALVMLGREDALDRRAPPQLVDALTTKKRARQQTLTFDARCEPSATGTKIHAQVGGVVPNVAVTLRIHVRGAKEGKWSVYDSDDVELSSNMGKAVSYYGELLGYGGVVLASAGSVDMPRTCSTPPERSVVQVQAASPAVEPPVRRDSSQRKKWWWLSAGGVLAIGAVTVAVLATRNNEAEPKSTVGNPMVRFE